MEYIFLMQNRVKKTCQRIKVELNIHLLRGFIVHVIKEMNTNGNF